MKSLIKSFIIAILVAALYSRMDNATWGTYVGATLGFIATYFWLARGTNKKLMEIVNASQAHIQDTQNKVQKKLNGMQNRPGTNPVAARKTLEAMQVKGIEEAIEMLAPAKELEGDSFLVSKQISTIKYQLYFGIKDFKATDELEPKIMLLDPQMVVMRMAREWMRSPIKKQADGKISQKELDALELTKLYKKGLFRAKGATASILYSTYAWMLLKAGQEKKSLDILLTALEKCPDEAIKANVDALRNNQAAKFSNKSYGDRWYALHLEEPKQPKAQKQQMRRGKNNRGFQPF
jgi:hypothetical protein